MFSFQKQIYTKYTINYDNWNKYKKAYKQIIIIIIIIIIIKAYNQVKRTKNSLTTYPWAFHDVLLKVNGKMLSVMHHFLCMLLFYW